MRIFNPHYGAAKLTPRQILRDPVLFCAFGFGSGLIKFMPGTWGALAGVPLYLLLANLPAYAYLILTLVAFYLGVYLCGQAAAKLQSADHGGIVWDEIVGLLITMYGLPLESETLLAGFAAFRLFDILKPWPINWLDRNIKGGLGVMLDDALAGVFAALLLRLWF